MKIYELKINALTRKRFPLVIKTSKRGIIENDEIHLADDATKFFQFTQREIIACKGVGDEFMKDIKSAFESAGIPVPVEWYKAKELERGNTSQAQKTADSKPMVMPKSNKIDILISTFICNFFFGKFDVEHYHEFLAIKIFADVTGKPLEPEHKLVWDEIDKFVKQNPELIKSKFDLLMKPSENPISWQQARINLCTGISI